ncbi:hypothetical protein [Nocardia sp. CS682]|uniref:hypothetical protein n=1 Tax=Nocardia sp. CS682 TaxID=1047172 RepID=UPI0010756869|nr:hypothetical protein [Nocardia sp. CS682]QBS43649.1 hypothetical protein DMB37_29640 [Nocardia sp. CS682]
MAREGVTEWQRLLDQANTGELRLSPDVGKDLDAQCQNYLNELDGVRRQARRVERVTGFGAMPSGPILEMKFSRKASGADSSLNQSLETHIEEVQLMRQVFATAMANYQSVDVSNSQNLAAINVLGEDGS